jgi:tryptophan 2,3-dioxygenase
MASGNMYYKDYLQLDKIIGAQQPASFEAGQQPAHDEMLFIIIHQAFELWFKQILFELDYVLDIFGKEKINDNSEDMNLALHRLRRVEQILGLLNQQVTILDTMTPMDFLEFRNLLTPASGFQSLQFRLIEARLGLEMDKRHQAAYYKRTNEGGFAQGDYQQINETESVPSLIQRISRWLERMPFFDLSYWQDFAAPGHLNPPVPEHEKGMQQPTTAPPADTLQHPFWNRFRELYRDGLTEREAGKIRDFDYVFFDIQNPDLADQNPEASAAAKEMLRSHLSPAAMRAALFTMLYRDFPVFQNSFRILDTLVEIDNQLAGWRHAHYRMVRRMIGMRVGTGNTSGSGYLEGAVSKHYIFRDIAGLSTYLIERKKLPKLPTALIRHLSFAQD